MNPTGQLPGRPRALHTWQGRNGGPVKCIRSFGDVIPPESAPDPFLFQGHVNTLSAVGHAPCRGSYSAAFITTTHGSKSSAFEFSPSVGSSF